MFPSIHDTKHLPSAGGVDDIKEASEASQDLTNVNLFANFVKKFDEVSRGAI